MLCSRKYFFTSPAMDMNPNQPETIHMNKTINSFWQQRIADTFQNALDAYPRVLMLRVDLRTPDGPAATDAVLAPVISRFTDALKAKIGAYIKRKQREGKRVHTTTLRFVWAREYGEKNHKKHYHVLLLLNRDTWCGAGDYRDPDSLAGLVKQAWCSALRLESQQHVTLANFPQNPALWLDRGNAAQLQQALARAAYLAKHHTKVSGDGERNFGCSRG
jgi:hypothetical protein